MPLRALVPATCRVALLAVALTVSACETPLFLSSSEPTGTSAGGAAPASAQTAAPVRPPQAARAQSAPVIPPEPAASGAPTIETIRAECWMKLETDRKAPRDLDKRVKLVAACVDDKSKTLAAQGTQLAH